MDDGCPEQSIAGHKAVTRRGSSDKVCGSGLSITCSGGRTLLDLEPGTRRQTAILGQSHCARPVILQRPGSSVSVWLSGCAVRSRMPATTPSERRSVRANCGDSARSHFRSRVWLRASWSCCHFKIGISRSVLHRCSIAWLSLLEYLRFNQWVRK